MGSTCQATVEVIPGDGYQASATRRVHTEEVGTRKQLMADLLKGRDMAMDDSQRQFLVSALTDMHGAFCLQEGERGETELVQFNIDTGGAEPKCQPPGWVPFAVRGKMNVQLTNIQSSSSAHRRAPGLALWYKEEGWHIAVCVDYRSLNAVTKPDVFPIPRIDNLLDQLGLCTIFSTLKLAAGYWQIKVHCDSQEKTTFTTYQGLYEFLVMPYGLRNAPANFQRTMQKVLRGLNPENGPDFVSVYIDNVLITEPGRPYQAHSAGGPEDCGLWFKAETRQV